MLQEVKRQMVLAAEGSIALPARLLVFDTKTGDIVQKLPAVGDCDDVFYDKARKRIYASGGDGELSVFQE
jgi:hypothetical protein